MNFFCGKRDKPAGRQILTGIGRQMWMKLKQWRECRGEHFGLNVRRFSALLYSATGATHFLKARFKGGELKRKVMAGICEFDSETLYFLTSVTPASFWLSLPSSAFSNCLSVCLPFSRQVKFTDSMNESIVPILSSCIGLLHCFVSLSCMLS